MAIEQDLEAMGQELEGAWATVQDMIAQDSQKELQEAEALAEAGAEVLDVDFGDAAEDFGIEITIQIPTTDQRHTTETLIQNPARMERNPTLKT